LGEAKLVFTALKSGADREDYERFVREVDYPGVVEKMKTIKRYRTYRLSSGLQTEGKIHDYVEVIEVHDRESYEKEIAALFKEIIDELYEKYLDRSKTVSIWSEIVEPE